MIVLIGYYFEKFHDYDQDSFDTMISTERLISGDENELLKLIEIILYLIISSSKNEIYIEVGPNVCTCVNPFSKKIMLMSISDQNFLMNLIQSSKSEFEQKTNSMENTSQKLFELTSVSHIDR